MTSPSPAASPLTAPVRTHPAIQACLARLKERKDTSLGGLWGAAAPLVLAAVLPEAPGPLLALCPGEDAAADLAEALQAFGASAEGYLATGAHLRVLQALGECRTGWVAVSSVSALEIPVPSPAHLAEATLHLAVGQALPPDAFLRSLAAAGLERVDTVEAPGEFSRHGGIADAFPPAEITALRIEWEGERIHSLRRFDPGSQRSGPPEAASTVLLPSGADAAHGSLLDHLPPGSWVAVMDPVLFWERAGFSLSGRVSLASLRGTLEKHPRISLAPLPALAPALNIPVTSAERLHLQEDLSGLATRAREGWTVAVALPAPEDRKRFESAASTFPPLASRYLPLPGRIAEGFAWPELKLAVLGAEQLLRRPPPRKALPQSRPIESFLDLRRGDYVVHFLHGIGRFRGLEVLAGPDGIKGEFLALEYQDRAVLYVAVSQIDLVQKYVGSGAARPKLSTLGERRWAAAKAQAGQATEAMAADLLRVQAQRETQLRPPYPADDALQLAFEDGFPHTLTGDQAQAMGEIRTDLLASRPMDRLLCGDVGFGKTELAMRAAFKAAAAGRQVAVLVPTTVLAQQHLETFSARMTPYAVRVESLSRFQARPGQNATLKRLAAGELDVVIGTHRLLQKDIVFRDLGLLVIDEEQRFGVAHKQRLRRLKGTVDVLTLTATPIPRTLHTALLGIRAISNLAMAPAGRQAIRTAVCPYADGVMAEAVRRELARGGRAFVVHNRVHSLQAFARVLRKLVPEARIAIGHGQMPPRELEEAMHAFVTGKADLFVCTTIIESGLDIPAANTLIVHEAQRFGLADLHQLRGRVGRSDRLAHAYFFLPEKGAMKGPAARRLKAIEEFCELGAGFQIALRDLEIRGAGNLLGPEQSGHIAAVGYELYCRLLDRAVRRLKGEPAPDREGPVIEVPVEAYLPEGYLPDAKHRMEQYRLLARAGKAEEIETVAEALADRFGPLPPPAGNLLDRHRLRVALPGFGISLLRQVPEGLLVRFGKPEEAQPFLARLGGTIRPQETGEVLVAGTGWGRIVDAASGR